MSMWQWGFSILFLAGVQIAHAGTPASDDPFLCDNYIEWLGAETQLSYVRTALADPKLHRVRRETLEERVRKLMAKVAYYRQALASEATPDLPALRPAQPSKLAGGELDPTPPVTLDRFFETRPQSKDVLAGGTRRLVLAPNGQALIVIAGDSRKAHVWDLKVKEYYTIEADRNIVDAEIDWNGNGVLLDATGTMTIHTLPTGTRIPSKAQLVRTRALALSDFSIFALGDGLSHSKPGVYGDFKRLDHSFNGKERLLRVTRDMKFAAVVTDINTVRVFRLDSQKEIPMPAPKFDGTILDLQFFSDTHQWAALTDRGQIIKWSARAPARYEMFSVKGIEVTGLAVGVGNQVIVGGNAFGGLEGILVAVDIGVGEETARYRTEQDGGVSAVTLSFDGSLIVTAGATKGQLSIFRNPAYLAH